MLSTSNQPRMSQKEFDNYTNPKWCDTEIKRITTRFESENLTAQQAANHLLTLINIISRLFVSQVPLSTGHLESLGPSQRAAAEALNKIAREHDLNACVTEQGDERDDLVSSLFWILESRSMSAKHHECLEPGIVLALTDAATNPSIPNTMSRLQNRLRDSGATGHLSLNVKEVIRLVREDRKSRGSGLAGCSDGEILTGKPRLLQRSNLPTEKIKKRPCG
ncbi:hypothetical protein KKG55_04395 [Candidatus Micrarchaeota archaeon]|nr:hypothetical protein [Candidatus Micrarchaeota archaeon]MBU1886953.1 hypothetical protein [Candidatus Micrarchaeota archaeon]